MSNDRLIAGFEFSVRPMFAEGILFPVAADLPSAILHESFHVGGGESTLNSFPLPLRNDFGLPAKPQSVGGGLRYNKELRLGFGSEPPSERFELDYSGAMALAHVRELSAPSDCELKLADLRSYLIWFHYYVSKVYQRFGYKQPVAYSVRRWDANGNFVAVEVPLVPLENVGSAPGYEGPEGVKLAEAVLSEIAAKEICRH